MKNWAVLGVFAVPVIEITLFVMIGGAIGVLATLGLILLSFFSASAFCNAKRADSPKPWPKPTLFRFWQINF